MKNKKLLIRIWVSLVIILWWWKFWHFVVQEVPLWYDPGRYRAYFLWYIDLLPDFNFSQLDTWIKQVFPPFVGMLVSIRYILTGVSLDWIVWSGVVVQSLLVSVWLYFFVSPKNKTIALIVAWMSRISFVQYEVFWWNYIKQLRWMFFLLIVLGLFVRKKYRVALPIIAALSITHRPALLCLVIIEIFWTISQVFWLIRNKENKIEISHILTLVLVWIWWWLIALPIYREFIQLQIPQLIRIFESSISIPQINDTFRAGGTFMTTIDFLSTNWIILGLSVIGFIASFWQSWWRRYQIAYIFGIVRVFGQLAFYQRMMWYADLFFLVFAGVAIWEIAQRWKWWRIVWVSTFVIHGSIYAYRVERTWRPIMEADEYAFMQSLPDILPDDAIVMNTHSGYSTWLKGRSERTTISPGLFDNDRRNRIDRQEKMREATGPEICQHLQDSYWDITNKLYIWQGSKQMQVDLKSGPCMSIFTESQRGRWTMYIADLE